MDTDEDDAKIEEHKREESKAEDNYHSNTNRKKGSIRSLIVFVFRLSLVLICPILAVILIWLVIAIVAVLAVHFPSTSPILLPSHCTILSSSVDLRSSKVEYKDHSLGQTRLAFAEAPNEALPLDCRPNFGVALLTKDIFKVNETYDCWYTLGISKVSLYRDGFFPCQAKEPSVLELLRHYLILSIKMLRFLFVRKKGYAKYWKWESIAGLVAGFSTSLISISFLSFLHHIISRLSRTSIARMIAAVTKIVVLKRAFVLVMYTLIMSWLVIQYWKRIGLSDIYRMYNY